MAFLCRDTSTRPDSVDDRRPRRSKTKRVAIIGSGGALFVVVRPWPIVAIVRSRLVVATSGRVGGWFNHRTAWFARAVFRRKHARFCPHRGSARRTAARRPACRPSVVPRFLDTLAKTPHFGKRCRNRSKSQSSRKLDALACPILVRIQIPHV